MKAEGRRQKAKGKGNFRHSPSAIRHGAAAAIAVAALAACGQQPWVGDGNYFTYDHPFTEAAAESARQNALGRCRQRDEIAIQTSRTCSLTRCTTSYQCISADDARKIGEKK
jgi:hypothetical protein